jgi:hypothetical protein
VTERLNVGWRWRQQALSVNVTLAVVTFQVSPDNAKLVLSPGDNCLHCFVGNLFKKQSTKYFQNRPIFMKAMVKNILACFLCPTV